MLLVGILTMAFLSNKSNSSVKPFGGIKFINLPLERAKVEAKNSGKIIFIDAHTSWCGPCKQMAATSFQNEKVAELYNSKYINLKIDVEKDPDGLEIAKMYKIKAYPTLLFINGDGKLVKSVVGFQTVDKLISLANSIE